MCRCAPPCEQSLPLYPRCPRFGPGYAVPVHHHLIGPIRPRAGLAPARPSIRFTALSLCSTQNRFLFKAIRFARKLTHRLSQKMWSRATLTLRLLHYCRRKSSSPSYDVVRTKTRHLCPPTLYIYVLFL